MRSAGTGQSAQLAAELFKLAFGLDIVHVPFNGGCAGGEFDRRRPHANRVQCLAPRPRR